MRICYLDAFAGISGDMTVGALIDAGAGAGDLTAALDSLGSGAAFRIEKTKRKGIAASKFHVDHADTKKHRHLPHILAMIDGSAMPARAKQRASAIFQRLGEAEARVHGMPIEKVHFHEVGAVDSIADICGACVALDLLGVGEVVSSPVNVGSGTVKTEHGVLPVPAPATAALLKDKPIYARGPAMELTTPTGAAILAALATEMGPMPALAISSIGYGAGDRDFPEHANILRATIGRRSMKAPEATTVAVIEANIDDSTPEVLGYALERLMAAGALDASLEPIYMKKNRPGSLLRVVARPEDREPLAALILAETSTLGVRMYDAQRRVQTREIVEVSTPHGRVRMKVSPAGYAPEYEDCRRLALESGVPLQQIIASANFEFLKNRH